MNVRVVEARTRLAEPNELAGVFARVLGETRAAMELFQGAVEMLRRSQGDRALRALCLRPTARLQIGR